MVTDNNFFTPSNENRKKYYAVRRGKTVRACIFFFWRDCKEQVDGYDDAEYATFQDLSAAEEFVVKPTSASSYPFNIPKIPAISSMIQASVVGCAAVESNSVELIGKAHFLGGDSGLLSDTTITTPDPLKKKSDQAIAVELCKNVEGFSKSGIQFIPEKIEVSTFRNQSKIIKEIADDTVSKDDNSTVEETYTNSKKRKMTDDMQPKHSPLKQREKKSGKKTQADKNNREGLKSLKEGAEKESESEKAHKEEMENSCVKNYVKLKLKPSWIKKYTKLKLYFEKHGNIDDIKNDDIDGKGLLKFMQDQRRMYRQYTKHASGLDVEFDANVHEKVTLLRKLNFKFDPKWEKTFAELEEYVRKHGHCKLDRRHRRLLEWVGTQKNDYELLKQGKPSRLDAVKCLKLTNLGLNLEKQKLLTWEQRLDQFIQYKNTHSHANIPRKDPILGSWICNMRRLHRLFMDGKKSPGLDEAKIRKLTELGFVFQVGERRVMDQTKLKSWEERFQDLLKFKQRHGHTRVPQLYKDDRQLGNWVHKVS
uniref:Helicase-associated domain-containing protein n=1 Tax=Corethron hystrix TaxID=216773 RepID=A0A7S1BMV1_9STRA|mmetsp:Transcript_31949/g.73491  ORF Transcript_31949/g.73491 Transcript_31949/m.73491 type:complete len:535 (+) Transcript_31949:82-1686(+)